jgi:nicotinamidase/pyrazinamidase
MGALVGEGRELKNGDGLLLVDIQLDFLPGGHLEVTDGDKIVPVVNRYIERFKNEELPIFATRDWHPEGHSSYKNQGGPWPDHCIAGSRGAQFPPDLNLPESTVVISKGTSPDKDAYSGFEGTNLNARLEQDRIHRLFIGGLATDYCVLNTVQDALDLGYAVCLLTDAIRAVDVNPDDGRKAVEAMSRAGAVLIELNDLAGQ